MRRVFLYLALAGLAGLALWELGAAVPDVPRAVIDPAETSADPIVPLPDSMRLDSRKVDLGDRLFRDPRLSKDDSVACVSCHSMSKGGADGRARAVGIGGREGLVNTPTVFNSAFNFVQFWDGRAATLEDQIDGPIHNPGEMGSTWPEILAKIGRDPSYARAFYEIYGGLRAEFVKDAIATYERSLVTPNSRFDRYLRGDRGVLTPREVEGYARFRSYGCIACHQGVNVGGNLFARLGVMGEFFADRGGTAPQDLGRFGATGAPNDRHVFKVPSLRNIALTSPYLHDGSVATLEQVVEIMAAYQLGVAIPAQDTELIVEFLGTLTGEYRGKPL